MHVSVKPILPISGKEVKKDSVRDVLDQIKSLETGARLLLLAPVEAESHRTLDEKIKIFIQQGFARIYVNGETQTLDTLEIAPKKGFDLVIDRMVVRHEEDFYNRVADAIELAFYEGKGICSLLHLEDKRREVFSNKFELDGLTFFKPSVHLFSFNNPLGACPVCEGFGDVMGIDPELVIPDTSKSIYDQAIVPWRGSTMVKFYDKTRPTAPISLTFLFTNRISNLPKHKRSFFGKAIPTLLESMTFFKRIEKKNYKIQNRVLLSRYRGKTSCTQCEGTRLKEEANYVKVGGKSIGDLLQISLDNLARFFQNLELKAHDQEIAERLLIEINSRLKFVQEVGLGIPDAKPTVQHLVWR